MTEKGRKFSHEFTTKGTFRYFCREHPTEVGEVVIEEEDTKTNTPKVDSFNAKDLELCLKAPIAEVRLKPPISQTSQVTGKDDTQSTTPKVDMATSCLPSRFVECVNVTMLHSSEPYLQADPSESGSNSVKMGEIAAFLI